MSFRGNLLRAGIDSDGKIVTVYRNDGRFDISTANSDTTGTIRSAIFTHTEGADSLSKITEVMKVILNSEYTTGDWVNAILGRIDYGSAGDATGGMAAAICAEVNLPAKSCASGSGAIYPLDCEIEAPTSYVSDGNPNTPVAFMKFGLWGSAATQVDSGGYFFHTAGLTAGAGNILSLNSRTLKVDIEGTARYIYLSDTEDDLGAAVFDTIVLDPGRIATGSLAGTATTLAASYTYDSGLYLRYAVTNWTGIGTTFSGAYIRAEATTNTAATRSVYGATIYGSTQVTMTTGQLNGALIYAYKKGSATATINKMYAVQAELTWDADCGTTTLTTEGAIILAKVTGGTLASYTVLHGQILRFGDMNAGSRTYGNGILIEDDADMGGTCLLTTGINMTIGSTTAISISGTCTTGINLAGCTGVGSNIILGGYGRISTSTYAGAALAITSTFTQNEGLYLRYAVASMTGDEFYGTWLRVQTSASLSSKRLTGIEVYAVAEHATGQLRAVQAYAYLKGTGTKTVGPIYAVSAELTCDGSQGTQTITSEAMCLRCKITGGNFNTDTLVHGVQIMSGDMDGGSPTYGNAIHVLDDPNTSGTTVWTTGLNIPIACTTGIDLGGAMTTGINMDGAMDNGIVISSALTTADSKGIKSTISVTAADHGDGYGAHEFDYTITTSAAGHTACLSAWCNIYSGVTLSSGYMTPMSIGIYEDSGATPTNSRMVCGARIQGIIGDTTGWKTLTVFSININSDITALWECTSFHQNTGWYPGTGESGAPSGYMPFMCDANANVKYIRLYDAKES